MPSRMARVWGNRSARPVIADLNLRLAFKQPDQARRIGTHQIEKTGLVFGDAFENGPGMGKSIGETSDCRSESPAGIQAAGSGAPHRHASNRKDRVSLRRCLREWPGYGEIDRRDQ